ncbi:PhzF family phenazine biosynthesis protein [Catenovulum sp. SM1970]|uniref:PhzF family phenazine biosynthesis protein n=1 Tax=Marinifaba aquimaris TaxID=2741323 RepID=UPI00157486A4|nr:PhzF family phenazine biosynthesis protein [Marinifaba aquimaris]NTS76256.1 PhzF family phenazine biosynthesis protein [Marinifaba aquimaris]
MKLTVHFIDAFSKKQFQGNAAAVIITEHWLADDTMQAIATENNLSETAFIVPLPDGRYHIRWFSPLTEIDFCGHATLASAFVLFQQFPHLAQVDIFAEAVGNMPVLAKSDGAIEMCFPNRAPELLDDVPNSLLAGLSIAPAKVLRNQQAYFAVYANQADVIALQTDNQALMQLAPFDVVATAAADIESEFDFVSRYFWPANGSDEDPVTGSIHTGLAPFWAAQLDKPDLVAYQASKRGGTLYCQVSEDKVTISGYAVRYLTGEIELTHL